MKRRILVIGGDPALVRVLADEFDTFGTTVEAIGTRGDVLSAARTLGPDLVLLDTRQPGAAVSDLCGLLSEGGRTPLIVLSARDQKADKLGALDAGADDYLTKPVDLDELLARIRALLRRARPSVGRMWLGDVVVDFAHLRAERAGHDVHLTRREFDLLSYLAERRGLIVHRRELLREIWHYPVEPATRAVDYAIKRLRGKLEVDPHTPRYITTVHGDGYSLTFDQADR